MATCDWWRGPEERVRARKSDGSDRLGAGKSGGTKERKKPTDNNRDAKEGEMVKKGKKEVEEEQEEAL